MSEFVAVIPARFESARLPGKPLLDLDGRSMIQRVVDQVTQSSAKRVIVATDDERVRRVVDSDQACVVMTDSAHETGSDRVMEVARKLRLKDTEIVVNVQGDEPLIPPEVVDQVAELLMSHEDFGIATLAEPINSIRAVFDSNVVKVIANKNKQALYFSRAPMPWDREHFDQGETYANISRWRRHVGIYAYRVKTLREFVELPRSWMEQIEQLEQLRFLENGYRIVLANACRSVPGGIDTLEDVDPVLEMIRSCS